MTVLIMRGLPGSGKTFRANELIGNSLSVSLVSASHFFMVDGEFKFDASKAQEAHTDCFARFLAAAKEGWKKPIVVDNTNSTSWEISPYIAAARVYGHSVGIIEVSAELEQCLMDNTHAVPKRVMMAMNHRLDMPLPASFPKTLLVKRDIDRDDFRSAVAAFKESEW